jgi:hypothetical protein
MFFIGAMNKRFLLALLASPTIFTSMMSIIGVFNPAHAAVRVLHTADGRVCVTHPHGGYTLVCIRETKRNQLALATPAAKVSTSQSSYDGKITELNFTEEESDAAIKLFGCDCPYCMNALRALRGQAPMAY